MARVNAGKTPRARPHEHRRALVQAGPAPGGPCPTGERPRRRPATAACFHRRANPARRRALRRAALAFYLAVPRGPARAACEPRRAAARGPRRRCRGAAPRARRGGNRHTAFPRGNGPRRDLRARPGRGALLRRPGHSLDRVPEQRRDPRPLAPAWLEPALGAEHACAGGHARLERLPFPAPGRPRCPGAAGLRPASTVETERDPVPARWRGRRAAHPRELPRAAGRPLPAGHLPPRGEPPPAEDPQWSHSRPCCSACSEASPRG